MTFEARLLMEPYIIENYSKYIDMDKLLDLEEQTKKILSSDILEQKDDVEQLGKWPSGNGHGCHQRH